MNFALPKALKTQKVNSLPGDLKDLAEELIASKFGIEEEVQFQSHDHDGRFYDQLINARMTPDGIKITEDRRTGRRTAHAFIHRSGGPLDGIADAMRDLDRQNLVSFNRTIYIEKLRYREIARDMPLDWNGLGHGVPQIWGADVKLCEPSKMERIEQRF